MATLSPKASAVVAAGRSAMRATEADRDRNEALLLTRLAAGPPLAITPKPLAVWHKLTPAIGVCLIGGAAFLALRPRVASEPKANVVQPSPVLPSAPSAAPSATLTPIVEAPAVVAVDSAAAKPTRVAPTAPSPSGERDQLLREVALMSRATSALSSGRTSEALSALNEHQREFPNGVLTEERRAAKAQALCSLGRVTEGRAELARLSPQSPAGRRAKEVCDARATTSPPGQR